MKLIKQFINYILLAAFYIISRCAPKFYARLFYRMKFGKRMDLDNPKDINEKINWLKFNSDTSLWTEYADKYRVRKHVADEGFSDMLVKLYGVWDKAEDIDWESLPNKFVMKANNGSGDILVCHDKSTLNYAEWTRRFHKVLKMKFGYKASEPHYNKIKPCIIAEELLDYTKQQISTSSLIDYKIWAFDGEVKYVWACYDRTKDSVKVGLFDTEWNFMPECSVSTPHYILIDKPIPKPVSLDMMLHAASVLSKGFVQLRIDFYEVDGKPYFGEMTFTSNGGYNDFYTDKFLAELGNMTDLNKCR